jgi:PAS domain S-box-containing protein
MSKRDSRNGELAKDRFRAIVEASPSAILMVDAEGVIRLANTKAEDLFGYSREDLVGQKIELLVPERYLGRHREDRVNFLHDPTTRPMGAGRDLFCRRKDGGELPVEIGLSPMETDEGTFVLASIIDITERKRSEEHFRIVVEASPSGILMVD